MLFFNSYFFINIYIFLFSLNIRKLLFNCLINIKGIENQSLRPNNLLFIIVCYCLGPFF